MASIEEVGVYDDEYCEDEECIDEDDDGNYEEESSTPKKKVPKKVEIIITDGHHFSDGAGVDGELGGKPYTSVDYSGNNYGGGSPCVSDEEIDSAIQHAKKTIVDAGDIPVVKDQRKKATLLNWFGGEANVANS